MLSLFPVEILGSSQYGDLHLGQVLGLFLCGEFRRGIHSWPHLSQRKPSNLILAIVLSASPGISLDIPLYGIRIALTWLVLTATIIPATQAHICSIRWRWRR